MEHANKININSDASNKDTALLSSAPSSPTTSSCDKPIVDMLIPEQRDQCETPSEDALRSAQAGGGGGAGVCGDMCDPAILAEVFFPVFQNKESVSTTDPTSPVIQGGADSICISPTYQKRGRFLVWPVSLTGAGPPLPPTSAVVNATTSA